MERSRIIDYYIMQTAFSSTLLLALSSVCGVGVDTFPIINRKENCIRVQSIIEDVIALASVFLY